MNITADGTYNITPKNHRFSSGTVFVSGNLSTSTATLNYNNDGVLTAITNVVLTTDSEYDISHGQLADVKLAVSGSDGSTDFDVNYHGSN